jgi:hypothetical protein
LNSTPNSGFRIDFYADVAPDPSGNGEGRFFLGSTLVTTNASGDASFNNVAVPYVPDTRVVCATAVASNFDTSEFSKARSISGAPPHLLNISSRLRVLTGDNALFAGFIVTGTEDKRVIVRGLGPSLSALGITNPLQDPVLEIYNQAGSLLMTNDDWTANQAEIEATGLPPANNAESAIVGSVPPGGYTAVLRGKNQTTGIGVLEVYDLEQTALSQLANVSTRGFVDTGDNVLIGGFIVGRLGDDLADGYILIRAIGPSLAAFGVANPLQDPTLAVFNANGTQINSNDDWKDTNQADLEATGLPPTQDKEAAVVQLTVSGNYTAIVRGKNNTTGIAVVEVYNLPY